MSQQPRTAAGQSASRHRSWGLKVLLSLMLSAIAVVMGQASPVERFVLENGLTVLFEEDHRLPLVNVTCMYRVGSVNEAPGITGVAHYVEHMNFRGTKNVSKADITGFINRIGGRWNGYTSLDQTLYAATVPAWALEETLRIEAERMTESLFGSVDFELERTSVISELQGYENDPATVLWDLGVATSFEIHPYRYNIIGWLSDLRGLTQSRARQFYTDYYGPNNAVLAIVGDVHPRELHRLVEHHFGTLSPCQRSSEVQVVEPIQRGEKLVNLIYPGGSPRSLILFRAPSATAPEYPVLVVLDALLSGGRGLISLPGLSPATLSGRLQESVAKVGGSGAAAALTPTRAPYVYGLSAEVEKAEDLDRLEAALVGDLETIAQTGVSAAELEHARRRLRSLRAFETQGLADRAHRLAFFEVLGSWKLTDSLSAAVEKVQATEIREFIRKWMSPSRRTVARHIPGERIDQVYPPVQQSGSLSSPAPRPSPVPPAALAPVAAVHQKTAFRTLENGARIGVAQIPGETAALHLRLALGSRLDPAGKEGLALVAARFVGANPSVRRELDRLGVVWTLEADPASFQQSEFFDFAFSFLADDREEVARQLSMILGPDPVTEEQVGQFRQELDREAASLQTDAVWQAQWSALALRDPERKPVFGTAQSSGAIRAADVNRYLEENLGGQAIWIGLAAPGEPERWIDMLARRLRNLPARELPEPSSNPSRAHGAGETSTHLAGKSQSEIVADLPGVPRHHPDYVRLKLLNYILGETGYAGRLGNALVDTGLAYSVYASVVSGRNSGSWTIQTGTAPENLDRTVRSIRTVLAKMHREGIEDWELREAQAFTLGRMVYALDSARKMAQMLCDTQFFDEDLFDFPSLSKQVLNVSQQELNAAARLYLDPTRVALGIAGPRAAR